VDDRRLELAEPDARQRGAGEEPGGAIAIAGLIEMLPDAIRVLGAVLSDGRDVGGRGGRVQLPARLGGDGVEHDLPVHRR
jgi:hypothetical protein